jgi:hypothetical protein
MYSQAPLFFATRSLRSLDPHRHTQTFLPGDMPGKKTASAPHSYLNFLDDIDAFESKKIKTEFYEAEFEL